MKLSNIVQFETKERSIAMQLGRRLMQRNNGYLSLTR